jgi:Aminotransferase class-V
MRDVGGLDVEALRAETPGCSNRIHLNNAGASLVPRPVLDAMTGHLQLESEIGGYEAADAAAGRVAEYYTATAALLGCRSDNVAFAASATDAFSRALSSIPFERGDVVLTTRDDYISNQIAYLSLRRRFGIDVVHAPNAPAGEVDVPGHRAAGPVLTRECTGRRLPAPGTMAVMDQTINTLAALLHEAAETHHRVYRIVDGVDDDWASWYGDWLVRLSELPTLVGRQPVRSELVYLLVRLDREYVERKPTEAWETYYARAIVDHFSTPTGAGG